MKKCIVFLFAFCFIAFACTKDESLLQDEDLNVLTELKAKKPKTKTLSIKRSWGTMEYAQNEECGVLLIVEGQGNANLLGRFKVRNEACLGGGEFYWWGRLTAANGDEINTVVDMTWEGDGYYYIIMEGTGRFEGAKGYIIMDGDIDYGNMTFELYGEGEITY